MIKTLAAVPYYWSKDALLAFYANVAESDFAVIYLGETVCSKRHQLRWQDWLQLARDLQQAGKNIVLSSLTLIESGADWRQLEKLCSNGEFCVEANDAGVMQLCYEQQQPFVSGAGINIYNAATVRRLVSMGCQRLLLPFDLPQEQIAALIAQCGDLDVQYELQVFGPLALAYSARCFTARHFDLTKDDCQFRCGDYPQGISLYSREQQRFLTINGIQTQSAEALNLTDRLDQLAALRITHARYVATSPVILPDQASQQIDMPFCNGFWLGDAGMKYSAVSK